MKWTFKQHNELAVHHLMKALPCGRLLAETLASRMFPGTAERLLHKPETLLEDPGSIHGIHGAAQAIIEAINHRHTIYVYADYDVDGLTSGYIMTSFLREVGAKKVVPHFPERQEGYGLSMEFCEEILEDEGEKTVITVDNGITKTFETEFLKNNGIGVVITDHHEKDESLGIPNTYVCDPKASIDRVGEHLCGAGVAWKICCIMETLLEESGSVPKGNLMEKYIPYVALGTVADVMDMVPENMALVNLGLLAINNGEVPLMNCFIKYLQKDYINAETFAWEIAPMLNACGRMGETETGAKLLFSTDEEETMELLKHIDDLNYARKKKQKDFLASVKKPSASDKIVLAEMSEKDGGIAGPVAGKVAEEYQRPSIVYCKSYDANGMPVYKGSVRSVSGVDILPFLKEEQEKGVIKQAGGHAGAAGITFYQSDEKMRQFLEDVRKALKDLRPAEKTLELDAEVTFKDLTSDNMDELALIPYDKNICPAPVFYMKDVSVNAGQPFRNKDHLVLNAVDKEGKKLTLVGWGMYPAYEEIGKPEKMDIAGTISTVGFNDYTTKRKKNDVTFRIMDMKAS